jgi:ADP-ribose pyrophosphatase YjhB (NUDIX family)
MAAAKDYPLSPEEFDRIYSKVPRLTVEVIVQNSDSEIYLTKRAIEPCKGQWHLPGGTVFFGESLSFAVKRIARRELGIEVMDMKHCGYIEYPSHYLHGLDSPVGLVFEVSYKGNVVINQEASGGKWFSKLPVNTHADQDTFLVQRGYLQN